MARRTNITLNSLIGEHWLDAVDYNSVNHKQWDGRYAEANSITIRLDGICYTAIEDPEDGYRSSMRTVFTKEAEMVNVFNPIWVVGRPYEKDSSQIYNSHDTCDSIGNYNLIEFVDVWNGKVVLMIGTDLSDSYYPSFVSTWMPYNLSVNEGK